MEATEIKKGLEGVVVDESRLSRVDGQKGELIYLGYDIDDMAKCTFEEVTYLFLYGKLPNRSELSELDDRLKANRNLPDSVREFIGSAPASENPMAILRTATSMLSGYMDDVESKDPEVLRTQSIQLIAQTGSLCAWICRSRLQKEWVAPRADLNHAANFLYMLNGKVPEEVVAKTLDVALVLHVDHSFNASTFTARCAASTLSDMVSAVTAGIGSLKGPLHGGANTGVMKALLEIGDVDNVEPWLDAALTEKKKVMGFGHRVYKVLDPRAIHLERLSQEWGERVGQVKWFEISKKLQGLMEERKGLKANVDFFSASTYYAMGIQPENFTLLFAMARITGWCAHIMEQLADNRLVRPKAKYIGDVDMKFVPLEKR